MNKDQVVWYSYCEVRLFQVFGVGAHWQMASISLGGYPYTVHAFNKSDEFKPNI